MSGTVTGLDLDRLEELAKQATPGPWVWDVTPDRCWAQIHSASAHGGVGEFVGNIPDDDLADFIAEFRNAVPSLLAAARANARIEAMVAVWEADERESLVTFGQHIPCSLATLSEAVRAALGTEQEGRD